MKVAVFELSNRVDRRWVRDHIAVATRPSASARLSVGCGTTEDSEHVRVRVAVSKIDRSIEVGKYRDERLVSAAVGSDF